MSSSSDQDQKRMKKTAFHLPHDIVLEILVRLPKKSLARCNCVSREWKQTLSHRSFHDMRTEFKRSKRQPNWIMRMSVRRVRGCWELWCQQMTTDTEKEGNLIKEFTLPPYFTCSGLGEFPCRSNNLLFYYSYKDLKPYLYDIKTGKIQQLPEASDHTGMFFVCGFGYSSKGDEYKVAHLYQTGKDTMMNCEVYSTRSNSWTRISEKCPCSAIEGSVGVVAYNKIHWKPFRNRFVGDITFSVVSFDLNEEKITTMPFPRECESTISINSKLYMHGYLAELKGRLCLVHHPIFYKKDMRLRVLAVKDYSEGTWEHWCNISLDFMNREPPSLFFTIYRVAYLGNQELAFVTQFGKYDYREVYCDMREGGMVTRVTDKAYGTELIYGKTYAHVLR